MKIIYAVESINRSPSHIFEAKSDHPPAVGETHVLGIRDCTAVEITHVFRRNNLAVAFCQKGTLPRITKEGLELDWAKGQFTRG